jgi:ABC-type glycerol-3-phosphate transport system substrate-binding protein
MLRKTAALALALSAFVAAGCGGDDSKSGSSGSTTGAVDSTEPVTITIWDWGVPDPKATAALDKAYKAEHPNVTIKRVHHPFENYQTVLRSAIAARKGPDAFVAYAAPFIQDFENGILPLNDLQTEEDAEKLAGWDYVTNPDGEILGLPSSGGGTQFYYNKTLFEKAGLDPEAPPTTWDELLTACDKLKAAGVTPIAGGWKDGYYAEWWLMQLAHQYQTDEVIEKATTPDWADPALDKAFGLIRDLYERGCFTENSEAIPLFPNVINEFKAGKAGIMVGLPSTDIHWGQFRETKWGKEGLGTFLAPLVPDSLWDEQRINFAPGHATAITRWSEHPDVVYDVLSFEASAESQQTLFEMAGALSNHADSDLQTDDPVGQQIIEWTKTANPYAGQVLLIRAPVESLLVKFVPDIITGKTTYAKIADQIVAEHQRAAGR